MSDETIRRNEREGDVSECSHEWFGCSKCGAAPERERACERLAAGYVRAEELDAAIERLEAKIAEYEALLERWRERERPWVERWQRETGNADALPDHGELLGWIVEKAEHAEAALRAHHDDHHACVEACVADVRAGQDRMLDDAVTERDAAIARAERTERVVTALRPVLDKMRDVPDDVVHADVDDSIALLTLTFGEVRAVRAALDAPEGQAG